MSKKQCVVCGQTINIDDWGNGKCRHCGWCNSSHAIQYPNAINPPNFVSFNEAKERYKENKKFVPSYDRCMKLVDRGFDIVFRYQKKNYQLSKHDDYTIWETSTENYKNYKTIEDFCENIEIEGIKLKNI